VAAERSAAIFQLIERLKGLYGDGIVSVERQPATDVEEFSGFNVRR